MCTVERDCISIPWGAHLAVLELPCRALFLRLYFNVLSHLPSFEPNEEAREKDSSSSKLRSIMCTLGGVMNSTSRFKACIWLLFVDGRDIPL